MHYSVLLQPSIEGLNIKPNGCYIDGTFGRGGHSREILARLGAHGRLIAFDRDPEAVKYAQVHFQDARFTIVHEPFSSMYDYCHNHQLCGKIDGILLDLGVSSPQLDVAERGFSFMKQGPLDMRMDYTRGMPASQALQQLDVQALCDIFRRYGEEKQAWKIANRIKQHLDEGLPLETTLSLAQLIEKTIGKKEKKHPATRCFQALRIYVNQELEELERVLSHAEQILALNGRLSIITFHSLEDRIVKVYMTDMIQGKPQDPSARRLPLHDHFEPSFKWIIKKLKADETELHENVRSRSAMLRVVEKI